jgi:hypothetical protein
MTKARDIADGVDTADIADGAINASKLNVSGTGTAGQVLQSDGDGSFTWVDTADPFTPTTVSGTTPSLDVGTYNFFDNGSLTGNPTLSFTNVPTQAKWQYTTEFAGSRGTDITNIETTGIAADVSATAGSATPYIYGVKPDGTSIYVRASGQTTMYQFNLSTPFDLSSLSTTAASSYTDTKFSAGEPGYFSPDGYHFYIADRVSTQEVMEFSMSTAWDLGTASYVRAFSVQAQTGTFAFYGVIFKHDGTSFYALNYNGNLFQYDMTTAWNISTASYANKSVTWSGYNAFGATFNADGTKLLLTEPSGASSKLYQFTLSTAWDASTATYDSISYTLPSTSSMYYATFSSTTKDNGVLYVSEGSPNLIHQYHIGFGSVTFPASVQNPIIGSANSYGPSSRITYDFYTADGGTNVYLIGDNAT